MCEASRKMFLYEIPEQNIIALIRKLQRKVDNASLTEYSKIREWHNYIKDLCEILQEKQRDLFTDENDSITIYFN